MRALALISVRRPRWVMAAWLTLAVVALLPAGALTKHIGNGGYSVPGSQSQRVDQLREGHFPATHGQSLAAVVSRPAPAPRALRAEARRLMTKLRRDPGIGSVARPLLAPSGKTIIVPFYLPGSLADAQKEVVSLRDWVHAVAGDNVTVVGQAAVWQETTAISKRDLSRAERISLPISLLILVAAFLSLVAASIPIGLAIVGLVVTFAALGLLAQVIDMSVYVTNTAQLLGLGLAIDYSLFIVSRYRERRGEGQDTAEAIVGTIETTGRAVLVSGVTIALGLSSLAVMGVGVFRSMAIGAGTAAALAALGALTLVPAVLRLLGPRIDRLTFRPAQRAAQRGRLWRALGNAVLRRRWAVLIGSIAVLLLCAVPALGTKLIFAGTDGLLPASNQLRQTTDTVSRQFGGGILEPVEILSRRPQVARVRAIARRDPGVSKVLPPAPGKGGWVRIEVLPRAGSGSVGEVATVERLRRAVERVAPAARVFVGGQPALGVDLIDRVESRFPLMILLACSLAFVLLTVALRSLIVPTKAVLTNLLSVAATLGLVTLIFQDLGGAEGLAWFVPPFLFAIVFGLSMDYEVFLLSRVREEYDRGIGNDAAVTNALRQSGRAITLAALVIMVVFLSSAVSSLESFRQLGVGMSIAVLLDATLVRCALVPAALAVLGDRNWWLPALLSRRFGRRPQEAPAVE
ncbi:MAG TPA: MMPL family transporter [Solirubrobacterales bacterium]|nr:MMPL family transporter [Solirubrobacterales bacterium]